MNDQNNDDNPGHISIKQVSTVNEDIELRKQALAQSGGDSGDEDSVLGSASADDFGDLDENDPDAGGVMDIDNARRAMGESNDGDGEHRKELTAEDLNLNALDDVSTPRVTEEDELAATE